MYSLLEFKNLKVAIKEKLMLANSSEPLICGLHQCLNAPGCVEIQYGNGNSEFHVAEACNVAAVVNSIERLLSLPRSNVACEDLSEVLLLRLDVLREYVRDLIPYDTSQEDASEKRVRAWAGFLKHPRGFVLAHKCIVDWDNFPETVQLDNNAVIAFCELGSNNRKDQAKDQYKNVPVRVELPSVAEIEEFFDICSKRMHQAIEKYA